MIQADSGWLEEEITVSQFSVPSGPGADSSVGIFITPKQTADFISKLSSDDAFRRSLEKNPQQVLSQFGIHLPPEHLQNLVLPSKQDLQQAINAITTGGVPGLHNVQTRIPTGGPTRAASAHWAFLAFIAFL